MKQPFLELIRAPERWTIPGCLPVRRMPEREDGSRDVIVGHLLADDDELTPEPIVHSTPAGCLEYPSLEALIEDGWVPD